MLGLIKSLFGLDKADASTILHRKAKCGQCPESTKNNGLLTQWSQCKQCNCFIQLKVKVKSEKCPIGKW